MPALVIGVTTTHVGIAAALGAAWCWVFTALAFAAAGRRIGPTAVNLIRILLAVTILLVINRVLFGEWWPEVERSSMVLLAVSGLVGLAIGDQLLFTALVDVGPRMTTLLMTSAPPIAAILAWPILDEPLAGWALVGILVTLAGIVWVVMERPKIALPPGHRVRGIVFGGLAGLCQAVGLILSKLGMGHVPGRTMPLVDPWLATLHRMVAATIGILIIAACMRARAGRRGTIVRTKRDVVPIALALVAIGAVFGPVLGVWCSMVAVDRAPAGIAATLMAMSPVFILPFAALIERERLSWRAVAGAGIAVGGVGILALAGTSSAG